MSRPALGLALCLLLTACVSERIVLLPSSDGRESGLLVRDGRQEILLDRPFSSVRHLGSTLTYRASEDDVQERFSEALAMRPEWPSSYILYFESGGEQLTAESTLAFEKIRREIGQRPASEVLVIGHTDSVGTAQGNDALSRKRAEAIRDKLIETGVPANKVEVVGRGEADPLIQTADEVDEPRNRRVEISLR